MILLPQAHYYDMHDMQAVGRLKTSCNNHSLLYLTLLSNCHHGISKYDKGYVKEGYRRHTTKHTHGFGNCKTACGTLVCVTNITHTEHTHT